MQNMRENKVVKSHRAHGITALFDALRRQKHGLALGMFRIRANRLSLADIEVLSMKGHKNIADRYAHHLDRRATCRILIADAGIHNRVYMDVESLAFLLDAAISSNPSHFLRRPQADKDSDD